ncbi:MAG: YdcF family protein [Hyphomicrobiales bacterium]|nr:YdcF family protein [Hyphomicrobiales bacterium]
MFFVVSKLLSIFAQPLNLMALLLGLAGSLDHLGKATIAKNLFFLVGLFFVLCGYTQISDFALSILERQHKQPVLTSIEKQPLGIIILGGTTSRNKQVKKNWYHLNSSAERITEAVILSKKYPTALLVFTGGSGHLVGREGEEALAFRTLFEQMGAIDNEVLLETEAKNTWQNAINTIAMVKDRNISNWLLVTSAFHMSRSIGSFKKAGMEVIAWPTDYRAETLKFPWITTNSTEQFSKMNILFHELLGILAYKLTDRL